MLTASPSSPSSTDEADPPADADPLGDTAAPPAPARGHSLRARTLTLVAALLVLLILILYFPLRSILLANTLSLEASLVATNLGRASETIGARVEALGRVTRSYAIWDDSYAFARGEAPDYPAINHSADTFVAEDRDLVLIADAAGSVLFQSALDLASGAELPVPALADPAGGPGPLFSHASDEELHSGLVWSDGGPIMVAAAPIVRSDGSGPAAGTLLFGRRLPPAAVGALGAAISLELQLFAADAADLPADVAAALPELRAAPAALVRPLDGERVAGYRLLPDIYGRPAIVLRSVEPRAIYAQGQASALYLALTLVLAVVVVGGAILLLLERLVLARVARLGAEMGAIGRRGDSAGRLSVEGGDELSGLAGAINAMLGALDRAEEGRRQEAEERLRLQGEVIEAERQLISRVSHELRTPLTPIKGFVDLLLVNKDRTLTPMQLEMLQIVRNNADRMIGLVDELLEIERAQAGRLELKLAEVEVGPIIESALRLLRPEAERRQITLSAGTEAPPPIEADARRLEQILVNLISNAVKYTPQGGAVEVTAGQSTAGYLTIAVRDNGIGMTAEQQKKLFTPFFRADTPLHNASNGTGLGLLITRTLVELHQGRVDVQSVFGEGSTFSVILPLRQRQAGEPRT